jgi:hypothetical protein
MVLVIRFPQAMGLLLVLGSVLGAPARAQTGEPILRIETGTHTARMSAAGADAAGQVLVTAAATEIPSTQPTATPILRLETGMHTADILARSVDAAGRLLLTASIDKTARLWSLPDGHLLTVLRPPQEFGQEGQLFGAALSPDGATAAVSGWKVVFRPKKTYYKILPFRPTAGFLLGDVLTAAGYGLGEPMAGQLLSTTPRLMAMLANCLLIAPVGWSPSVMMTLFGFTILLSILSKKSKLLGAIAPSAFRSVLMAVRLL